MWKVQGYCTLHNSKKELIIVVEEVFYFRDFCLSGESECYRFFGFSGLEILPLAVD